MDSQNMDAESLPFENHQEASCRDFAFCASEVQGFERPLFAKDLATDCNS